MQKMNIDCYKEFDCHGYFSIGQLTKKTFICKISCIQRSSKCCYLCSNLQCYLSKTSVDRFRFIVKLALLRKDL